MGNTDATQNTRILLLEKKVQDLTDALAAHKSKAVSLYQTQSAAATVQDALNARIDDVITTLEAHTAKFVTVKLPDETQYYLTQNQITGLKKAIAEITSLKTEVRNNLRSLIAAWKAFKEAQNS